MTTTPVMSITDEQIAEIEARAKEMRWQDFQAFQYTAVCGQAYCLDGDEGRGGVHLLTTFEPSMQEYIQLLSPSLILALISRLSVAEKDAGRYRYFRLNPNVSQEDWEPIFLDADSIDAAIDAAMTGEKP